MSEMAAQPPAPNVDPHNVNDEGKDTPTDSEADVGASPNASENHSKSEPHDNVLSPYEMAERLWTKYDRTNNITDLDHALDSYRLALKSAKDGNPPRDVILYDVAYCLNVRYDHVGEMNDLTEAISLLREAEELRPPGHPKRDNVLNDLSVSLFNRYDRTGDEKDLEEAIHLNRETLELRPPGHPNRDIVLNNLASCLNSRYRRMKSVADLSEAIQIYREILKQCQPGDPVFALDMFNLASCLQDQYRETQDIQDLNEAIDWLRKTLELWSPGDRRHGRALERMAACLQHRFNRTRDAADIAEAIRLLEQALEHCPPGHLLRTTTLIRLAGSLSSQLSPDESQQHSAARVRRIIHLVREATRPSPASIKVRIWAANTWRSLAQKHDDPSELEAARETLNLLDLAVAESASVESLSSRFSEDTTFINARGVGSDAAVLAILRRNYPLAVSLLEQGRSAIFSGLGRYRSAIENVREASHTLAERFVQLSAQLDSLVVDSDNQGQSPISGFQDKATRYSNIRAEWDRTVKEIRNLPGLGSFLLPPPFHHLQQAADHGPVVIVNINKHRSDAIIVISSGKPVHVRLPDAHPKVVQRLVGRLGKRQAECDFGVAIEVLRETWRIIVAPVVTGLRSAPIQLPAKSRIWWCPVGAASMLPLHAAGPYKRGEDNLAQIFISSYTPTLGALIRARQTRLVGPATHTPVRSILVVGQSDTPNQRQLPAVIDEIRAVTTLAPDASVLQSSAATKGAVLQGIQECKWLHLACHGHHHPTKPFKSHFSMYDGPISLLDLISKDLPQAELAVLSACHSARVSEVLPDESLHPAAGMLFAGFKSVIGTMWAFDDGLGAPLAEEFYKIMLNGEKDYTHAAVALGDAFREVMKKDKKAVSFMQFINVVHYGV